MRGAGGCTGTSLRREFCTCHNRQCAAGPSSRPCGRGREGGPKAAPKPPPKKGLSGPYGNYTNIRVVLQHFGGRLVGEQRGTGELNVCPWSQLEGAGQCPWRAGRHLKPSRLHPKDLHDHLARGHGSEPVQREQADAMIKGIMPVDWRGPLRWPGRCRVVLAGLRQCHRRGAKKQAQERPTVEPRALTQCPTGSARRQPPAEMGGRGRCPVVLRDRSTRRPLLVPPALRLPPNQARLMIRIRQRCREGIPPLNTQTMVSWNVQGSMRGDGVPRAPGMLHKEVVAAGVLKAQGAILGVFNETSLQDPQGVVHMENQWRHHGYHAFLVVDTQAASAAAVRGCLLIALRADVFAAEGFEMWWTSCRTRPWPSMW